jgi:3-oxoacyl-[acyl-carrier-protein] synthase III
MKILAVEHVIPSRHLSNENCMDLVRDGLGPRCAAQDVHAAVEQLRGYLEACGTRDRYVSNVSEKAIDHALEAGRRALQTAEVDPLDIEFVIYTSVSRGWIEPATFNVIQAELGLRNATGFDLLDACASWLRALQVGHSLIRSGTYRTGLIVNCECSVLNYLDLEKCRLEDFPSRLACFTMGEAATATVLGDGHLDDDFYFRFQTYGEHYQLCMIPLENAVRFIPRRTGDGFVPNKFFAHSAELMSVAVRKIIEVYFSDPRLHTTRHDIVFSHAASQRASDFLLRRLDIAPQTYFGTHEAFGNTVTAAVPLAMSTAIHTDRLHRGDRVLVVMGSAGVSVGFASFTY